MLQSRPLHSIPRINHLFSRCLSSHHEGGKKVGVDLKVNQVSEPQSLLSNPSPDDLAFGGMRFKYYKYLTENISPYMSQIFKPKFVYATKDKLYIELPFSPLLVGNPQVPCLHGGAVATILDHAGGFVAWGTLEDPKQRVNTADLRVDYLLPAPCELLLFEATVIHKTKKMIRTDINCYDKISSAIVVDPITGERKVNLENYQNKRIIATGRALFNVYSTHSDLNVAMEKLFASKQSH